MAVVVAVVVAIGQVDMLRCAMRREPLNPLRR